MERTPSKNYIQPKPGTTNEVRRDILQEGEVVYLLYYMQPVLLTVEFQLDLAI
jgi:hypothetical protein